MDGIKCDMPVFKEKKQVLAYCCLNVISGKYCGVSVKQPLHF